MDFDIYNDIAARSGGDIYVGVVGPVRTGKSTLIKKFMTELVIPYAEEGAVGVMTDELSQSAAGKTVMTTEPKFVPSKAARVKIENAEANVRFCDCVGFAVDGAQGFDEGGAPRLVNTPWSVTPLPFSEAASEGTQRVISKHSTIGICVTCDGSIAEIPREGYLAAEERTVRELKAIGKPFIILLNCVNPESDAAQMLKNNLQNKYGCTVIAENCLNITAEGLLNILKAVLFEFPVTSFDIKIPDWLQVMPKESSAIEELLQRVKGVSQKICKMRDCSLFDKMLSECKYWDSAVQVNLNLSNGCAELRANAKEGIFFEMLSELAGDSIDGECSLMRYISGASEAKKSYDKIKDAFECAKATGYGIVQPDDGDMSLDAPQIVRKGASVGIKLKATAPSYHIVKVDVSGEVSPIMGSAAQSEGIVQGMMSGFEINPDGMWETDVFGKSLRGMVKDGLNGKVNCMHDDAKAKMRRAITRIVNEGRGNIICILL